MIPVYQYLNQQSLTVTSVQQHVTTPLSRFYLDKEEIFVQETEATICDYRGALERWSTNGYTLSEV